MKGKNTPISSGSVLISSSILTHSAKLLGDRPTVVSPLASEQFLSLTQLLETIVLHDKIYTVYSSDQNPLLASGYPQLNEVLENLINDEKTEYACKHLVSHMRAANSKQAAVFEEMNDSTSYDFLKSIVNGVGHKANYSETEIIRQTLARLHQYRKDYYSNFIDHSINLLKAEVEAEIEEMNNFIGENRFSLELPMVAGYVLETKGWSRNNIFDIALEIRESKEATAFREFCKAFDQACRVGDSNSMFKLKREIEVVAKKLKSKLDQPTVEFSIEIPFSVSFSPFEIWKFFQNRRKRHLIFLEKIFEANIRAEGLRRTFFREF